MKILDRNATNTLQAIPQSFAQLPSDRYCSLGADVDYYERMSALPSDVREAILNALNDIVAHPLRTSWRESTTGYKDSLLRFSGSLASLEEGPVLLGLKAALPTQSSFAFDYITQLPHASGPHRLSFELSGSSTTPRRLAVIIGANGTGKTTVLKNLAASLGGWGTKGDEDHNRPDEVGTFLPERPSFRNVIAVSFSAFDDFERPPEDLEVLMRSSVSYRYVGNRDPENDQRILPPNELCRQFDMFLTAILGDQGPSGVVRRIRRRHLKDGLSRFVGESAYSELTSKDPERLTVAWNRLSSGQRIVALALTGVLASVDKRSVVLLDEPETHLHPGLLGQFMALLSEVLESCDSFAILATHHPFVIQQVPASGVQVLARRGNLPLVVRPNYQTFGSDLGTLLESSLGLSDPTADWREEITRMAQTLGVRQTEEAFEPPLGPAARSFLRSTTSI